MPRFNASGAICQGYNRTWFDQTRTIGQVCNTPPASLNQCVIALSDHTVVAPYGAEFVSGGGGQWAAWSGSAGLGVTDSHGNRFQDSGIQNVGEHSPDGAYAIKVLRNSFGPWDVIEADGSRWRLTEGDASSIQLLGSRRAMFYEGGRIRVTPNMNPILTPPGEVYWPRLINVHNQWLLLYQCAQGLVFDGHLVALGTTFYRPDAILQGDTLRFTWGLDEGESRLGSSVVTLSGLYSLPVPSAPVPVPPVPVPVPPKPEPVPVPVSLPNILSTVKAVRAMFPDATLTPDQAVAALNLIARQHDGFGLLRKDGGNHGKQPGTGIFCSCDWLVHKPSGLGLDAFGKGPDSTTSPIESGECVPQWGDGEPFDLSRFVAPVTVDNGGSDPDPTPAGSVGDALDSALGSIRTEIVTLRSAVATIKALEARIAALEARKPEAVTGLTDGSVVALKSHDTNEYVTVEPDGDVNAKGPRAFGDYQLFTIELHQ